jgi:cbb3-type cytochrome oxidase maturation protein
MSIVFMLMPIALLLGLVFLISFIFAARQGQFDDLETPSYRILIDDEPTQKEQP